MECTPECSHTIMPLRTWDRNNWLILNSDTSDVRRSAAIQSCPCEIIRKCKSTGLSSTAIHRMYAGVQPYNHALDRLQKCRRTGLSSTAIHRMYAGVQPSNHALEIVQECKHCTTTENKRMKYFSFVPSIFNEMVTSYLHRSTESMFMTENEFFASFPFFVTYDIRTVKKKFCEKIYRRKEPWSEERSMCSFLASRFQILLHF